MALWLLDRQEAIAMGLFSDLNKKLTENLHAHGSYLSDPSADLPRRVEETVDLLMAFVKPEARETVKLQILGIIHEHIFDESDSGDRSIHRRHNRQDAVIPNGGIRAASRRRAAAAQWHPLGRGRSQAVLSSATDGETDFSSSASQ